MLLRLPYELAGLFREWLETHLPERAGHVMSLIRQMRGGRSNDPRFGHRMRGSGEFARLLESRFRLATRRLGLASGESRTLDCAQFVPPRPASAQLGLF
jgi:DNA repair photolyase